MKQLLLLLVVLSSTTTQATNYYVSSTGNDANNGLSPATAWKSIKQVNGFNFAANDHILFNRGDIFNGFIRVNRSNLFFEAYGTGANPLISGFATVSSWTNVGGNIWESNVLNAKAGVDIVTVNGEQVAPGRYPNTGYLTYQSSNSTSYTAFALPTSPSFTGGECVARKERWIMDRQAITSHSGTTLNVATSTSGYGGKNGAGLFIQKHINTLDLQSEWVFTSSTGKLKMYSTSTPAITKICVIDTLLYTANYSNITIDGLTFEGAGYAAIFCENSNTIKIKNCIIRNAGQYGILIFNSPGITINNNQIYDVLGLAVYISNSVVSGNTVTNNYIKRSGCIPGLGWKSGGASDDSYSGMVVTGNGSIIQYNVIDSVGYKGISFGGSNVLVANNLVSNYCMVKDDGGGIYTWSNNGSPILTNRVVRDNIILNSIGAPNGTASSGPESHGIYMDGAAMNVDITGNTVINSSTDDAAIFFNNTSNIKVKANTLYNVAIGLLMNRLPDDVDLIRTMTVTGNIIYPTTSNFFYWNGSLNVPTTVNIQQDMRNMFTKIDSNYYRSDISDPFDWYYHLTNGGIFVDPLSQSLETWKTTINGDANSVNLPIGPNEIKYNPTSNPVEYNFSGFSKKDVYGNIYNNSVTIPAWSSKILIPNGITIAPNITPIANAGEDIVITLPTSIASLTGTGTDTDGIITSYKWSKIAGPDTGTINSPNSTVTSVNSLVAGVYLFELTVQDNRGAIAKDTVQLTVNIAANQLPVADAGADQIIILPINTTTLTGNGIDFDGTIASFSWAKIAGPSGGTIVSPNALTTEINNLAFGEFLYELSVTDNNGAVSADTVLIRVDSAINQAPVADAGSNLLINLPENSTLLKGTGTDVDGSVISYSWIQISGPTQGVIVSPGNDSTTISNLEQGTYIFELTVTDNHGAISSDIVQVAVNTGNFQATPIANAGTDQVITLPIDSTVLSGIGTDIDGTITSYKWEKISGPALGSISSPNDTITNVVGLGQGIYQYRLTVTDNAGANARDTVTLIVMAAPNQPPVANAGTDTSITLPANSISIVGSGSDVDGTISSYNWVKIAGPVEGIIASPNSGNTSIYNLVQGVYKFELMVQDDKGLTSKDSVEITVNAAVNQLPETDAGIDQIIDLPINTTTLTGLGFDFDGTIVSYTWAKISGPAGGDIISPDSAATVINNLVAGVFQFELSVKDNNGATTSDTIQITVNVAPKQAPVADAGANQLITLPVNSVTLTGSGTDADGTIISYSWAKILGPAANTLSSPNTSSTQVNNLVQGLYEFELTVTDNDGLASTDTMA